MTIRPFVTITLAGLVLIALARTGWLQPVASLFQAAAQPVLASETKATRQGVSFFSVITSLRDLARENANLVATNRQLEAELVVLKEVNHENQILRSELNFIKTSDQSYIPSQLIGKTAAGVIKDLIVSRGRVDGVAVGQPVIAQGYFVGVVSQVNEHQATVRLISHPRSIVPTLLQESRTTGLLRGGISGLAMTDILIDATLKPGESVVTSGLGGDLPAGLPIGKITAVTAQKGDITKRASVSAPIDIAKLEMVFIRKE